MRQPIKTFVLVMLVCAAAPWVAPAAAQQTCTDHRTLAEEAVPTNVGNATMMMALLNPPIAPQFVDALADRTVLIGGLRKLGTRGLRVDKSDCRFSGRVRASDTGRDSDEELDCTWRSKSTHETLELELAEGNLTYLNPMRDYDGEMGVDNMVTPADAVDVAFDAALALGAPEAEVGSPFVRSLKAAMVPVVDDQPDLANAKVHTAELYVSVPRHVEGTPVFGSEWKTIVDAKMQVARLHVRWPRFCIVPRLDDNLGQTLMSREDVIQAVTETLGEENMCDTLEKLSARIMYVSQAQEPDAEVTDPRDERPTTEGDEEGRGRLNVPQGPCYMPALVIHARPVTPREDSGDIAMGAPQYVVPLLRGDDTKG